ncbi:MAG TPA: hypothetical protein VF241_16355 [Propionibacteriaceae bacterium]
MTDLFERRLAEQLQAHPLPEEIPDLGIRSVRLGERIRRRRLGAVVVALVLLLIIPVASGLWRLATGTEEPPVISPTSPPPQASTPQTMAILDLRLLGAAPEVSTVRQGSVWFPSGETVKLPNGQFGSIAEYGSKLAWLTRAGGEFRLNVSAERLPIATNGSGVSGVEPGPSGSVMVRTKAGPVFLTSGGTLIAPSRPELRTNRMVATADDLWVENGGRVLRVQMADLESGSFKMQTYPQWRKVVVGDPRADRVVVIDDRGCQAVLNGSTAALVWRGCDWKLSAFSSDGRLGAGRSLKIGAIGIIELGTGQVALGVYPEATVGPQMVFDDAGRLNFRVGDPGVINAFAACDLPAQCWMSSVASADPIGFVLPNRK